MTRKVRAVLTCCALAFAAPALAGERLLIPEEVDFPFYARGLGHTDPDAPESWVMTAFVRPPECVPEGANPLAPDPNIDPDCELFVEGWAFFHEDSTEPHKYEFRNRPGELVPIWFVEASEFLAALNDDDSPGIVTMEELLDAESLMMGLADSYSEEGVIGKNADRRASGLLEDGRTFDVRSHTTNEGAGAYRVIVTFGE